VSERFEQDPIEKGVERDGDECEPVDEFDVFERYERVGNESAYRGEDDDHAIPYERYADELRGARVESASLEQ